MFITTSSPNPQIAYTLRSAGGNLVYTLGLHRSLDGIGLAPEEIEQRRNVFWVFYMLEKAIGHNLGRPSVINDDDIAVELPPKKPGILRSPSGAGVYDIFQDSITLAIIGSRIYTELYSASSQTKSEEHRTKVLGKLDNHLQRWRDAIPIDIRPEHPINCSDEQYVSVVMMHFTYLDAVILLHRISGHHTESSFKNGEAMNLKSNDQGQLQSNPRHASSDVQLLNLISAFINHSVQPGTSFADTPTLNMFKELYGIATRFVARAPSRPSQKMKRPPESDDLTAQSDYFSSSRGDPAPFESTKLYSDPPNNTAVWPSPDAHKFQTDQAARNNTTSPQYSQQESSNKSSPLELAPFIIPPEQPSLIEFDPTMSYDGLFEPNNFDWDMPDMWMSSGLTADPWGSGDLIGLPLQESDDINQSSGYFNQKS
ncbi:hypothetical protein EIK77_006734 [Talaromyces pinophilus]|nr:hypothetical protein EIK77_006734 [Talaromyces pinophilus]